MAWHEVLAPSPQLPKQPKKTHSLQLESTPGDANIEKMTGKEMSRADT